MRLLSTCAAIAYEYRGARSWDADDASDVEIAALVAEQPCEGLRWARIEYRNVWLRRQCAPGAPLPARRRCGCGRHCADVDPTNDVD